MQTEMGEGWYLDFHDFTSPLPAVPNLNVDLTALARSNGARDGTPFFVSPTGLADSRVNRFWREPAVRGLSRETLRRYAYAMKVWFNFLHACGTTWDAATPAALASFKEWRLTSLDAPKHVSSSTFRTDLAALRAFYDWAAESIPGISNPVRRRAASGREASIERLELSPTGGRRADVKWLTPDAYRLWRDVGLAGFALDGLQLEDWVGANEDRDVAFTDTLYGTGLRRAELSSLLTLELPNGPGRGLHRSWLSSACAKGGRGRPYWVPAKVADQMRFYLEEGSRGAAVSRAQRAGRYEGIPRRWVLKQVLGNGTVELLDHRGQPHRTRIDSLPPVVRSSLFRDTAAGLEPLALWLNQDGMPRQKNAWNRTFSIANDRVKAALARRGQATGTLFARPHMLRHSFALRWYTVATFVAWQRTAGLSQQEQRDLRHQMGDVWFLLASLLGHRSPETTRDYYLEPFQALQVDHLMTLLEADDRAALERLVDAVVDDEPRVLKVESA